MRVVILGLCILGEKVHGIRVFGIHRGCSVATLPYTWALHIKDNRPVDSPNAYDVSVRVQEATYERPTCHRMWWVSGMPAGAHSSTPGEGRCLPVAWNVEKEYIQ